MNKGFARIIGIAGGTGSGKSWLANFLKAELGARAAVLSQDWYYKDRSGTNRATEVSLNFDHPRAFETGLLLGHLDALRRGRRVETPRYDFATHSRATHAVPMEPAPVVIIEGLFVLHQKSILKRLDDSVFVEVPAQVRLERRLRRDAAERSIPPQETLRLYETFARPMHERFVQPSAARARHLWRPLNKRECDFPARFARELGQLLTS
jgi:uridine kinase